MTVAMGALVLVGAVGIFIRYAFVTSADEAAVAAAPRISDAGFEKAASGVCKQYAQVFDTATTLVHLPSQTQTGDFLESIARSFDSMVGSLHGLPVVGVDQAMVGQWLSDWDAYDAYGHRYAAAVRSGAERDLVARDKQTIDHLLRRRNGFAKANHMSACAFN